MSARGSSDARVQLVDGAIKLWLHGHPPGFGGAFYHAEVVAALDALVEDLEQTRAALLDVAKQFDLFVDARLESEGAGLEVERLCRFSEAVILPALASGGVR